MIPVETIDRIYSSAKIEDVVRDYVSLKRRGANLIGLCPFPGHTEKTPSFTVSPARNICKCFGCGRGGNSVNFIMEVEQCSYPEALRKVAKKFGIEVVEREQSAEEKQRHDDRESMFVVNEWANKWFQNQLWNTEEGQSVALAYFHERGLRDDIIKRFQLGFSPEKGNPMTAEARKQGFKEEYLVNNPETHIGTGVCGKSSGKNSRPDRLYDRYHGRVIFPIHSVSGKTVGFAGRIMVKKENVGKYVNSPDSVIYSKTKELYGLFLAKQSIIKQQRCYLVEGQMDVISMVQAGIENVVCSGGTALTREQIRAIHNFTDNITILYDGDAAGVHAALRGIDMFLDEGMYIKVMLFPDGDDPDSFARKHTAEEFVNYINTHEEDFIQYKARTLLAEAGRDMGKRNEAIQSIITSVASVKSKVARDDYAKLSAEICGIPEQTLRTEAANVRVRMTREWWSNRERQAANGQPVISRQQNVSGGQTDVQNPPLQNNASNASPTFSQDTTQSPLQDYYKQIIRLLVLMGDIPVVFDDGNGGELKIMVGDYIQRYLSATQIHLDNPLYRQMFDEFNKHKQNAGFRSEPFFLNHLEPAIASLATDVIADEGIYDTDELTQHIINSEVLNALYDLHLAVVKERLSVYPSLIAAAGDSEQTMQLLAEQRGLNELKAQIAKLRHRIN